MSTGSKGPSAPPDGVVGPSAVEDRTTAVRSTATEEDTSELLLDPGADFGELDALDAFEDAAAAPAEGTRVISVVAADVQRALDIGVSMAATLIEPLPAGQRASVTVDDGTPTVPITKSVTVIGRSKEVADVVLGADDQVSRQHAAIIFARGDFYIEDLESSNGTMVGGRRIKRAKLSVGEPVQIGRRTLRLAVQR